MKIKSTTEPTSAMKMLAFISAFDPEIGESSIKGKYFTLKKECNNIYCNEMLKVIPAGTVIQADFGGDFGLHAFADVGGVLHRVKIELHELHKIDFGEIPDDVIEQADKALKEIRKRNKDRFDIGEDY